MNIYHCHDHHLTWLHHCVHRECCIVQCSISLPRTFCFSLQCHLTRYKVISKEMILLFTFRFWRKISLQLWPSFEMIDPRTWSTRRSCESWNTSASSMLPTSLCVRRYLQLVNVQFCLAVLFLCSHSQTVGSSQEKHHRFVQWHAHWKVTSKASCFNNSQSEAFFTKCDDFFF